MYCLLVFVSQDLRKLFADGKLLYIFVYEYLLFCLFCFLWFKFPSTMLPVPVVYLVGRRDVRKPAGRAGGGKIFIAVSTLETTHADLPYIS